MKTSSKMRRQHASKRVRLVDTREMEVNFFNLGVVRNPVLSTGEMFALPLIALGPDEQERDGLSITLKSVSFKHLFHLPPLDAGAQAISPDTVRWIVFIDKQANGALPAVTDLLDTAYFQSEYNVGNEGRFIILLDETESLLYTGGMASDGAGLVSHQATRMTFQHQHDLDLTIQYGGDLGAIMNITSNNLLIFYISQAALIATITDIQVRYIG